MSSAASRLHGRPWHGLQRSAEAPVPEQNEGAMSIETRRRLYFWLAAALLTIGTFVHQYAWEYFEPRIPHRHQDNQQ
jgi:hypothetical protein